MQKQKLWADIRETKRELFIKFHISKEFYPHKHTKWKNWIKAICDKVEMNTMNGGKLNNLNKVRNGTKLSALYPHSELIHQILNIKTRDRNKGLKRKKY